MSEYLMELGSILRKVRKLRGLTIQQLADKIQKSKSTLSKYERGEISIDILTIKEISRVLNISIDELLPGTADNSSQHCYPSTANVPSFFKNNTRFYSYYYDGRNKNIICSALLVKNAHDDNSIGVHMYMNIKDINYPQACENTYYGLMTHHDIITRIDFINRDTSVEKASIAILSPFVENDERWGLWSGISTRPVMPASIKMLFTKTRQKTDIDLKKKLMLTQEDYKLIKLYNMFTVF